MKVLHSISSLDIISGGPSLSAWSLVAGIRNLGINAEIITYLPQNDNAKMIGEGNFIHALPSPKYARFGYSSAIKKKIKTNDYDLYHGHGLWQYPMHAMATSAIKKGKPYLISPRGMLYPEALKKSAWFKKIALPLFQLYDLKRAAVIHATCMQEMKHIKSLGIKTPIAVIPNSIDITIPIISENTSTTLCRVGFMGRFAPIKNIETLIEAYAAMEKEHTSIELVLIGDGPEGYKNQLKAMAANFGIKNVSFTGFLSGPERELVFRSLSLLVLPSKSENFGMVVPEALLRKIPVIASKGTPWEELNAHHCGWWVDFGVEPLRVALEEALSISEAKRIEMGKNGRKLVEEKYSIEAVAEQMIQLYKWILKEDKKPEFVYEY